MKKSILYLVSTALIIPLLGGCPANNKEVYINELPIHHDDEFGGAFIEISIERFNYMGFTFGDSLDLEFSNGKTFEDIGYYSGYYVAAGSMLVVGYPGYEFIKFCINYGNDIYAESGFDQNTTVNLKVNEAGKYKVIEETLSISYSDDPNEYPSEEAFANFREVKAGNIASNTLYRGASPIDNRRNRVAIVDKLIEEYNIQYDIDLADNRETINSFYQKEGYKMGYFEELDEANKVLPLGMGAAYKSEDFSNKLKLMFEEILNHDAPYYVHCLEGKDRTGYVIMILEALCGADYDDLIDDYFITYQNYYGINKEQDSYKYEMIKTIHIDEMIRYAFSFNKSVNLLGANYHSAVNDYLLEIGLTQETIDAVQTKLSKAD